MAQMGKWQAMILRHIGRTVLACLVGCMLLATIAAPARAAVTITFYSRDLGSTFPHAFFIMRGTLDATGTPVDVNYGFTAVTVTPAILLGSVAGKVERPSDAMVSSSDAHASAIISDAEYEKVLAIVEKWRTKTGKSYNLNKANCVHFVAEVARAIGMDAPDEPSLMKKPKSFLTWMTERNGPWVAARRTGTASASAH